MKDILLQIEEIMEQPEFISPYAFIETSPINSITNVQLSTSRLFGRVLVISRMCDATKGHMNLPSHH